MSNKQIFGLCMAALWTCTFGVALRNWTLGLCMGLCFGMCFGMFDSGKEEDGDAKAGKTEAEASVTDDRLPPAEDEES